jgi:nucleotide-binding universal stress UspA family protein
VIMTLPRTILVAHDLSKRADRAFRRALLLSQDAAHLVVFNATTDTDSRAALRDILLGRLQVVLGPIGAARLTLEVQAGRPDEVAAKLIRSHGGDLLVVGLHGKKGLAELLATNTTARMISSSPAPTLVAQASPPTPYRNILVGIDFAETASAGLALARAWFPKAEVTAVHAFDVWLGRRAAGPVTLDHLDEARKQWLASAVARANPSGNTRPIHSLFIHGTPAEALRKTASDEDCDLIVVGRHNRNWLIEAVLGSVARTILANPPCDVLIVPPAPATATL